MAHVDASPPPSRCLPRLHLIGRQLDFGTYTDGFCESGLNSRRDSNLVRASARVRARQGVLASARMIKRLAREGERTRRQSCTANSTAGPIERAIGE